MIVRADDNDVRGVVVLRMGEIVDVVGCEQRAHRHRKGHPVIEQRPVHSLLPYESIVVTHQNYISFFLFFCLLLLILGDIFPSMTIGYYFPVSPFIWANTTDNSLFLEFSQVLLDVARSYVYFFRNGQCCSVRILPDDSNNFSTRRR